MQNLHLKHIKQGRTQDAEGSSVSSAFVRKTPPCPRLTRLFAFRRFLSGPDNPAIVLIAYQFVFKLSGCREESFLPVKEAARCFGAAARDALRPPTRAYKRYGLRHLRLQPTPGPHPAGPTRVPPPAHPGAPARECPTRQAQNVHSCRRRPLFPSNPSVLPAAPVPVRVSALIQA